MSDEANFVCHLHPFFSVFAVSYVKEVFYD